MSVPMLHAFTGSLKCYFAEMSRSVNIIRDDTIIVTIFLLCNEFILRMSFLALGLPFQSCRKDLSQKLVG